MKTKKFSVRISIAIVLGIVVLMLSGILMMVILNSTNLFSSSQIVEKTFTHTAMFVFSVLIIFLISKGDLRGYGFVWNWKFPFVKVVFISLLLGLISSIIGTFLPESTIDLPTASFSLLEKILYIWIWASISEEVLSRGLIQGYLSPLKKSGIYLFGKFISIPVMVGAIFFGAMHLALLSMGIHYSLVIVIVVFGVLLGLIAGYQKEKTGSLVPAIIVHFCFNAGGSIIEIVNNLTL